MKKIISALIILAMLCSAIFAAIPTFADELTEEQKALETVINAVKNLKERDYTYETWAKFAEALEAANNAFGDQYPDATKLTEAKTALEAAEEELKEVTFDELKNLVSAASEIEKVGFSDATWSALQSAIGDAEEFIEENEGEYSIDEEEIKDLYSDLAKAVVNMKYDTTKLYGLINQAKVLVNNNTTAEKLGPGSDYTKETYDPFKAAYDVAIVDVKSNDYAKITASETALDTAIKALVTNPVPDNLKTELADLLDLADVLIPEQWSESAWKMVEMKVTQAKKAHENVKISTYVIAINELKQALMNLTNEDKPDKDKLPDRPVVDTSALDTLIKWCDDNLVESAYDADSWRKITEALVNARAVAENPRKAEEVQAAYDRLNKARLELVAVEGAAGADDGVEEVGCNGFIATTFVVMSATLALGATVVLRKKED